jgi:hypothetical protein
VKNGEGDISDPGSRILWGDGCLHSDPDFVDDANGDYHLDTGSPCIDAGSNSYVDWDYDLGGNWRIIHDTVEIGAYEYGIFKDTAEDRGIQGPSGGAENVVWEDFDGDGYPDMYVTSSLGSNILYLNDGPPDQTFTDATQANGVAGPTNSRGACAADYDNDGDVDLLVCNESGDLYLYRNNRVGLETNNFTEVAEDADLDGFSYSVMACWGDFDNDSYVDLYVVKSQGNCKLFQNDGDGTFTDVTSTAGVSGPSSGSSAVWCDIDSDGDLDLFVVGATSGSAKLYQNDGDGTFTDITSSAGADIEGDSVAFGDIDNDGDFDFCVAVSGASNYLLKNNYSGTTVTFSEIASSAGVSQPTNAVDCYFTDFDNDGDIDLNITANDGNTTLFSNNGDLTFGAVDTDGLPAIATYAAAAAGQDLCNGWPTLWGANSAGYSSFWEQRPNGNNWIVFLVRPSISNLTGIGTRVELTYAVGETTYTITREKTAGAGWGSQGSVGLHMGLAGVSKDQIQEVRVSWPSGVVHYISKSKYQLNSKYVLCEPDIEVIVQCNPNDEQLWYKVDGEEYTAESTTIPWFSGQQLTIETKTPQKEQGGVKYVFDSWNNEHQELTWNVTPQQNETYSAFFDRKHRLNTAVDPANGGTVTPSGENWYDPYTYEEPTEVTLTATPSQDWSFLKWAGDPPIDRYSASTTITMEAPKSVTAIFAQGTFAKILCPWGSKDANPSPPESWISSPCYHFDFQAVTSGSPGAYVLSILGKVEPSATYGYEWTWDAQVGALENETTSTPTHSAPATPGEGTLTLEATTGGGGTGITDDREVEIYEDHLERDYDNFKSVGSCKEGEWSTPYAEVNMPNDWNCHGSVDHGYNGSGSGYKNHIPTVIGSWNDTTTYNDPIDWDDLESELEHGAVVTFWRYESEYSVWNCVHSHSFRSDNSKMFGANNEAVFDFTKEDPASWKWAETTSKEYYNKINTAWTDAGNEGKFITRVKLHKRP